MSKWTAKIRRDHISWWAEVYQDGTLYTYYPCMTQWGAKSKARKTVKRLEKLERTGWLDNPTRDV